MNPLFPAPDLSALSSEQRQFFNRLPEDYRDFLMRNNGGRAEPHSLNFYTNIPYDQPDQESPSAQLPSRPDFVEIFMGFDPDGAEEWDDILHFNQVEIPDAFPDGMIQVARGHYGDLAISIDEEDRGVVYYQWRHFPSVADHYQQKRDRLAEQFDDPGSPEAGKADELALLERLAGSWTEFLDSFIPEETADLSLAAGLEMMQYDKMYEQIKRRVACHNVAVMLGSDPSAEGLRLFKQISAGFLPVYWEEDIKQNAPGSGELYVAGSPPEDDWIFDRMLDALMLTSPPDPRQFAILGHFGKYIGYPVLEINRSVADYHGRVERDAKRQAPPLHEIMQNAREQALRTIQTLYLIGIEGGEVTPNQDRMFAGIAGEGELDPEELMFVVRHREGLGMMPPLFKAWAADMKQKVAEFLRVDGEANSASEAKAQLFYELLEGGGVIDNYDLSNLTP